MAMGDNKRMLENWSLAGLVGVCFAVIFAMVWVSFVEARKRADGNPDYDPDKYRKYTLTYASLAIVVVVLAFASGVFTLRGLLKPREFFANLTSSNVADRDSARKLIKLTAPPVLLLGLMFFTSIALIGTGWAAYAKRDDPDKVNYELEITAISAGFVTTTFGIQMLLVVGGFLARGYLFNRDGK